MTSGIARSYARALFDLAEETGNLLAVEADLDAARDLLHKEKAAREFLGNKLIGRTTKKNLIRQAFEGKVDSRLMVLLYLLANRGRTDFLGEIAEEYERLSRLARGVRNVKVYSAFPLGKEEKALITRSLEERFKSSVDLRTEVRPSLIGGVVAESEGQEIELTIQGQLKGLADRLEGK
ncbi:MAG TPA: ATP synthase F1 subunit delta [Spirochaetia bacterium]|nr:ATP synthase F1 subunit delta [Spirochaetia bacterium]